MDYKSPIGIYTHEPIVKEMEDGIMRAIVSCGVQIDKDELIRALVYDREQYRAGYEAAERKYKRPTGEWIVAYPPLEGYGTIYTCPFCGQEEEFEPTNFCPNCGAKMKGAGAENHIEIRRVEE